MMTKTMFLPLLALMFSVPVFPQLDFDKSEYVSRREKLMDLCPGGVTVLRGAPPAAGDVQFCQFNNLMYYTGLEIPGLILVMDGKERTCTLFSSCTEGEALEEGIPMELIRDPGRYNGIENQLPTDQFTSFLSDKIKGGGIIYTPFRSAEMTAEISAEKTKSLMASMTKEEWDGRLIRELQFVKVIREKFPDAVVEDCWAKISDQRKIKSDAEIAVMREAGRIAATAHRALIRATAVGVTERHLANLFEYVCKEEGAQDLAYYTIIMSGENMPYGHYHRYNRILREGDFVVLDAGPSLNHYSVDFSSSFPANGKFTPKQKELYELANAIREVCVKSYRPGITLGQVGQNVRQYLVAHGYDPDEPRFQGYMRYGGYNHSIGMAVHDGMGTFMGSDEILQKGFVFACDINMIYPEMEMGFRLEDTVVITADGCEILSAGLPRTVQEMETLMSDK